VIESSFEVFPRIKRWLAYNRARADYKRGNHSAAFQGFEKSANAGFPMAQYYLGLMYNRGHGTPVDFTKAEEWIRKSEIMTHSDVPTAAPPLHRGERWPGGKLIGGGGNGGG
jgi:TPR repeat protein